MSGRVAAPVETGAAELSRAPLSTHEERMVARVCVHVCVCVCVYVCDQLVLRIVLNTRNNLWTGHDDDWNIYSARYVRCTFVHDGISESDAVQATAPGVRATVSRPTPLRDGNVMRTFTENLVTFIPIALHLPSANRTNPFY